MDSDYDGRDLVQAALRICEQIIDNPTDPEPQAAARRLIAAHPEVYARLPAPRVEVNPDRQALIDRDLAEILGPLGVSMF